MSNEAPYLVRRPSRSRHVTLRGLRHHVLEWGDPSLATPARPTLLMQHGWMDVAASFQFIVDALPTERHVLAFDWRGFGLSDPTPGCRTTSAISMRRSMRCRSRSIRSTCSATAWAATS
jgi:pimeloyl-ACP methyl ester carboxylesterase